MATVKNDAAKRQIIRVLNEGGYPTYARLLNLFDIYLTDNPEVVGYMEPGKAKIVLNGDLDIDQISTIVRHEMLHEWLTHQNRYEVFKKANQALNPEFDPEDLRNIAADFEISNVGYTDKDKQIARRIKLGDQVLQGLVTEDQYPGWTKMSFEDMLKELLSKSKEEREKLQQLIQKLQQLSKKELEDMQDEMDQQQDQSQQSQSQQNQSQQSQSQRGQSQQDQEQSSKGDNKGDQEKQGKESKQSAQDKKEDQLSKELDKVQDKLDDIEKDKGNNPIDSKEDQEAKKDLIKRVEEIKKAFEDIRQGEEAVRQAKVQKQAEKQRKIKQAEDRMRVDPLHKFKLNLNRFIADQIEEVEEETFQRINPSYEDSDFILPGTKDVENKYIPIINVYHDTSGSFTSHPEKQKMVDRVIATLQKYADNGDIKINRYYHADRVAPTRDEAGMSNNGNNVIKHIQATHPDNVIITTDGDLSDTSISATVPGSVWMLFFDNRSDGLIKNLHGKKQTKVYDIDY